MSKCQIHYRATDNRYVVYFPNGELLSFPTLAAAKVMVKAHDKGLKAWEIA